MSLWLNHSTINNCCVAIMYTSDACDVCDNVHYLQSWNDYESYYHSYSDIKGLNVSSQLEDSAYMFDAVWAAALALNNTDASLVNFTYNDEVFANFSQSIYSQMISLKFFGLTVSGTNYNWWICVTESLFTYMYVGWVLP